MSNIDLTISQFMFLKIFFIFVIYFEDSIEFFSGNN